MRRLDEILAGDAGSHILPFLWMKGEDNRTLAEELDKIEECGIREICLESRPHPDFCGPLWWETMDYLVPEAKRRGLRLWILDDRKFPTGYANGGFERRPELGKWYLAERHMDILGPCRDSAVLVENFLGADGRLLGILACPKPDTETLDVSPEGMIDLTDHYKDGFVFFDLPKGAYRLFVLFETQAGGGRSPYMNLIDSASVRVLLDEVYEKHYARYGEHFGKTIAGFFSDEPELGNVPGYPFDAALGQKDVRLPWSRELSDALRAAWGEAFLYNLPALWYGMGEKTGRVRFTYMDRMTDLVHTCFSGQIGGWCAQHGVEYIGHIIEDDNAHARLGSSIGHYFKEMQGQHIAGVDVVHHQIVPGFTGRIHQWIAGDADGEFFHFGLAKMGSSAAHLDPKKKNRALCEIFGNYGWGEGVSLMKWLTNHMLVRGINTFVPHAFSMTYPDRDCPPHFYARGNNPEFAAFAQLMRYMQRAAHLLSDGQPAAEAAVLYHAEAEWTGQPFMLFQKPLRALMEGQLDADVVPAGCLTAETAAVSEGSLAIGKNRYGSLVLPGAVCIPRDTADFVVKAAGEGLPVFAVGEVPSLDTQMRPLGETFGAAVRRVELSDLAAAVRAAVPAGVSLKVTGPGKDLRFLKAGNGGEWVYMFFNENIAETLKVRVQLDSEACTVVKYDPWTNRAERACVSDRTFELSLLPGESAFYVVMPGAQADEAPLPVRERTLSVAWKVSRADELHYGEFRPVTELAPGEPLPNMNGPAFTPGFTGWYRYDGTFDAEPGRKEGCELILPRGGDAVRVEINGRDLGWFAGFPVRVDLSDTLRDGENTLRLEFATTLVWKRKDGASTHLQLFGTGLLEPPVLREYGI